MVAWFAGLFYLPRLFVYHAAVGAVEPEAYDRFAPWRENYTDLS
jgi:protoporphyrinogen IX oxidase